MNEYDKLIFQIQQWPCMKKVITADFTKNTVTVDVRAAGVLNCRQYTHAEMQQLFNRIHESHPEYWAECYDSPVLDGTVWQLQLFHGRQIVCESRGFNRFPQTWHDFWHCLQKIA